MFFLTKKINIQLWKKKSIRVKFSQFYLFSESVLFLNHERQSKLAAKLPSARVCFSPATTTPSPAIPPNATITSPKLSHATTSIPATISSSSRAILSTALVRHSIPDAAKHSSNNLKQPNAPLEQQPPT